MKMEFHLETQGLWDVLVGANVNGKKDPLVLPLIVNLVSLILNSLIFKRNECIFE